MPIMMCRTFIFIRTIPKISINPDHVFEIHLNTEILQWSAIQTHDLGSINY